MVKQNLKKIEWDVKNHCIPGLRDVVSNAAPRKVMLESKTGSTGYS